MSREFTWDPTKAASNKQKHGISFDTAALVFADDHAIFEQDRIVDGERRWRIIGWAGTIALLVVAYVTWDETDGVEVCRIISARPADRRDRRRYERGS